VSDAGLLAVRNAEPMILKLDKRVNCQGKGNFVLYEFPNGSGGNAIVCVNGFVTAGCLILLTASGTVLSNLASQLTTWVTSKVDDASSAGPQTKHNQDSISWGQVYNYSKISGSTKVAATDLPTVTLIFPDQVGSQFVYTTLELHEDGFSATASAVSNSTVVTRLPACYEQIHVHYWAAAGHDGTVLSPADVNTLMTKALNQAYNFNYALACFEMTNNGRWDGYLRVCFNQDLSQVGCYTCGGHNN
jgi:hypothetical protein